MKICYWLFFKFNYFFNRWRAKHIAMQEQLIMAYGGLRGAVAFSLVEMLQADTIKPRQIFVTTTLIIILFTVFIQVYIFYFNTKNRIIGYFEANNFIGNKNQWTWPVPLRYYWSISLHIRRVVIYSEFETLRLFF